MAVVYFYRGKIQRATNMASSFSSPYATTTPPIAAKPYHKHFTRLPRLADR